MKCLAINTANSILSVALVDGEKLVYAYETAETRDQGNLLLSHVQFGLKEEGMGFDDIDLLSVVTGPGSFTGIRIGLAAMRGIALASSKPIVGISSFELFAEARAGFKNIVCLESWREELYIQPDGAEPVNVPPEDFAKTLPAGNYFISGDAAEKLAPFISGAVVSDKKTVASDAARLGIAKYKAKGAQKPLPFYLRDADVTISTKS
jgi:tRNA threonylcarbamoyladenosine biosynthesis protein TsaB